MTDDTPETTGFTDRLKGAVKQVAGQVTGNAALKHEGDLHHEKAAATENATELAAQAQAEQEQAAIAQREAEIATERERLAAEATAERRTSLIEHEQAAADQQAKTNAAQQASAADAARSRQEAEADSAARSAAQEHADQKARAAELEAQAARAQAAADTVDQTIEEQR
jgi:uncharacterized protein YjbJ (UPF0337 family)